MSFSEFLNMGGHGFYVWLSYGVGLVVTVALLCEPRWRRQRVIDRLKAFYRREQLDQAEKHDAS
ncbi:heme exporter protein CcmD [Permianibacter aggregans]|uniref:Heme exporter protein D n=1 Tax=Permianibacter aggregans TaxID=1510150 RepID=A0A4R6UZV1_9GAMM|nr:heme exporter protein CcmD [Permianibacter aggregans]QGX41396.1 heme exporter protein CcmD [Permianibacter aggregans]TDQ51185.1 heme exporter protein D [Permianibacter aggregans]